MEELNEEELTKDDAFKLCQGVHPPIFHMYRSKGIYVFKFYKEFNWRYVIVDDRIPCDVHTKKPLYGMAQN